MPAKQLTQKQIGFTQDYFREIPPGQAYMTHYNVKSMSVADTCASKLLKVAKIKAYLQELRDKAISPAVMSLQEMLETHTEIARGRVGHFLDDGHRIKQDSNMASAAIQELDTSDIKIGRGEHAVLATITKLKLHDPVRSMQEIARLRGHYPKEAQAGDTNINVVFIIGRGYREKVIDGNSD